MLSLLLLACNEQSDFGVSKKELFGDCVDYNMSGEMSEKTLNEVAKIANEIDTNQDDYITSEEYFSASHSNHKRLNYLLAGYSESEAIAKLRGFYTKQRISDFLHGSYRSDVI